MIVANAIGTVDSLVPNTYSEAEKVRWLRDFDMTLYKTFHSQYKDAPEPDFDGYGPLTELLIEDPFSELYVSFLESKIYRYLGEIVRYNNAAIDSADTLKEYKNYYNKNHEFKGVKFRCFTPTQEEQALPNELRRCLGVSNTQ